MGRRRERIGWPYDAELEEFHTPSGRIITLANIAQRIQDDVMSRYDLTGAWEGWTIRGCKLRPPQCGRNGPALTPGHLPAFLRWCDTKLPHGLISETAMTSHRQPADKRLRCNSAMHIDDDVVQTLLRICERARTDNRSSRS